MTPDKDRQAAYRTRQSEKLARRTAALETIVTQLRDNDKPLGVRLRTIAEEALR